MEPERRALVSDAVAGLYLMARFEVAMWSPERRQDEAAIISDFIGIHSDTLVAGRGAQKRSDAPSTLGAVARGIALLAESEGGVAFLGRHYCTTPHPDLDGGICGPSNGKKVTK